MHTGGRRKGRGRSRILYWFRTPPGVRVGRAALDEEAIRLIEEYNPDVEFDWTRILKGQGLETSQPPPSLDRDRRGDRTSRRRPDRQPPPPRPPAPVELRDQPGSDLNLPNPENQNPALITAIAAGPESLDTGAADLASDLDFQESENRNPTPPSHARLGSEGLSRLRARHAEVLARISERVQDSARQEELKARAERLNPDTWVTDAEVTAGLEAYESVFEDLRSAIGGPSRRRRRKRRRSGVQHGERLPHVPSGDEQTDTPDGTASEEQDDEEA